MLKVVPCLASAPAAAQRTADEPRLGRVNPSTRKLVALALFSHVKLLILDELCVHALSSFQRTLPPARTNSERHAPPWCQALGGSFILSRSKAVVNHARARLPVAPAALFDSRALGNLLMLSRANIPVNHFFSNLAAHVPPAQPIPSSSGTASPDLHQVRLPRPAPHEKELARNRLIHCQPRPLVTNPAVVHRHATAANQPRRLPL